MICFIILLFMCILKGWIVSHYIITALRKGFNCWWTNIVQDVCNQSNF